MKQPEDKERSPESLTITYIDILIIAYSFNDNK